MLCFDLPIYFFIDLIIISHTHFFAEYNRRCRVMKFLNFFVTYCYENNSLLYSIVIGKKVEYKFLTKEFLTKSCM